jgi:hypothetical protein
MTTVRAHVQNGTVVLDEPLNLPDGTPVTVSVSNDVDALADMDPDERAKLEASIEEGYADFESGDFEDARTHAARLQAKT